MKAPLSLLSLFVYPTEFNGCAVRLEQLFRRTQHIEELRLVAEPIDRGSSHRAHLDQAGISQTGEVL